MKYDIAISFCYPGSWLVSYGCCTLADSSDMHDASHAAAAESKGMSDAQWQLCKYLRRCRHLVTAPPEGCGHASAGVFCSEADAEVRIWGDDSYLAQVPAPCLPVLKPCAFHSTHAVHVVLWGQVSFIAVTLDKTPANE